MKQEDKELLLKDLSSRLPHGVNVEYTSKAIVIATNTEEIITRPLFLYSINTLDDMTVSGIDDDGDSWICFFEEIKPYLLPLSSMTGEQKQYISDRWGVNEDFDFEIDPNWGKYFVDLGDAVGFINWCYANHFDINGLIPMGIALDATGLEIY